MQPLWDRGNAQPRAAARVAVVFTRYWSAPVTVRYVFGVDARHVDVLVIGAGISGIGAACHLTRDLPHRSYRILERRARIGGTWDLFLYPGVRSDSDMYTFGFNFRPGLATKVLADGTSI